MGDVISLRERQFVKRAGEVAKAIDYGRSIAHAGLSEAKAAVAAKYPGDRELQVVAMLRGWSAVRHA